MTTWLASATAGDRVAFRIGRDGAFLVAEWIGVGRLEVHRNGSHPTFRAEPGAPRELLEKIENGTMRALLRHLRGALTLHAAAVERRGGAIALVGDSGAGKSTLAFELASAASPEFSFLSDDCLCIEGGAAVPSETLGWLDAIARRDASPERPELKAPLEPARIASAAAPLGAIVRLAYGDAFGVRRLRGADAAAVLARAMIRFVLDEPEVHRADMERLAEIARDVPILELTRPRGLEHLPATIALLGRIQDALAASNAAGDDLEARVLEE